MPVGTTRLSLYELGAKRDQIANSRSIVQKLAIAPTA